MRRLSTAMLAIVLLGGGVVAFAALKGGSVAKHHHGQPAVTITGHVDNLQPGVPSVLYATARNNTSHRVRLLKIHTRISDAGSACPRSLLRVKTYRPRKPLQPHSTRRTPLVVTLSPAASDACQSAVFPLEFRARAIVLQRDPAQPKR